MVKAFADQRGAIYGDNRTKLRRKWTMKGLKPLTDEERAVIKRRQKDAEIQAKKDAIAAQKAVDEMWAKAKPCEHHPYLELKGIEGPVPGLKSMPDKDTGEPILLIPMYNSDQQLRSIQRIWPDGTRKQSWGVRETGLFNTIGGLAFKETNLIHVCEGWVTGYSIHLATEGTVAVAFFDGGLKTVAVALRKKYPKADIRIASDNDRWTKVWRDDEKVPNPGVTAAREAAKAAKAKLCIPDFADLSDVPEGEKGPTDYNDLHQREGLDAVREWLDPKMAELADTTLLEPDEKKEEEDEETGHWTESFPSKCLGSVGKTHYFIHPHGQLIDLSQREMGPNNPVCPRPESVVRGALPDHGGESEGKNGLAQGHRRDRCVLPGSRPYHSGKLRGRGVWRDGDEGGVLVHLGDRLLPPGKRSYVAPADYTGGGRIYLAQPRLEGPHRKTTLKVHQAREILELFQDLLWEHPTSAYLLAGWVVLAPLSGYLRWRPHVWVTGDAGCGRRRSSVISWCRSRRGYRSTPRDRKQRRRDFGKSWEAMPCPSSSTSRKGREGAAQRVKVIIRMMRSASASQARSFKGGATGKGKSWETWSMFCLGSVGGAVSGHQDRQRTSLLQLRHPRVVFGDVGKQKKHYEGLQVKIARRANENRARQLLGRTSVGQDPASSTISSK